MTQWTLRWQTAALVLVATLLALTLPTHAQQGSISSYTVTYRTTATPPVVAATETVPVTSVVCNQAVIVPPITTPVNPTLIAWNDVVTSGKDCVYTAPTTSPLRTLPDGSYTATLIAINPGGSSPESTPPVPFSRLSPPAAPTGVVISKSGS